MTPVGIASPSSVLKSNHARAIDYVSNAHPIVAFRLSSTRPGVNRGASPGIVAGRIVTFIFVRELGDDVIVVNSQFQSCRDSGDGESFSHHHGHGVTTLVHLAYVVSTYHFFDVQTRRLGRACVKDQALSGRAFGVSEQQNLRCRSVTVQQR